MLEIISLINAGLRWLEIHKGGFLLKKAACVIISFLFIFTLVSCGAADNSKIVGTYQLTKAQGVGINLTSEQIDSLRAIGMTATLEMNDDNTAVMDIFGEELHFTYDIGKMIFIYEGKKEKFTFDGEVIAFNNEGRELEFTKVS